MPGASAEKMLQYLDLLEWTPGEPRIRRAALLLFGIDVPKWHPRAEIRLARVAGTILGVGAAHNVAKEEVLRGNLFSLLERVWQALRPYLAVTKLGKGSLFQETLLYPEDACVEAIVNALAHRDYASEGRSVEIFIFDDRLELRSPGELLSTINIDKLKNSSGAHDSRNPFLTRVLREIGHMRELGEGMARMFDAMEQRDLIPPELSSEAGQFIVRLHHESIFSQRDQLWLEGYSPFWLSRDEQRVMLIGRDGHAITPRAIRTALNVVDTEDYRKIVESLQRKGLIASLITSHKASKVASKLGRNRADVGRYVVRGADRAQRFLEELIRGLITVGPHDELGAPELETVKSYLSSDSPYVRSIVGSLRYLEFVDHRGKVGDRLRMVWAQRQIESERIENKD